MPTHQTLLRCGIALSMALLTTPESRAQQAHLITKLPGSAGEWFGRHMANMGDMDKDGFPELAIGNPTGVGTNGRTGTVRIVSTKNLETHIEIAGPPQSKMFGQRVVRMPDVDGDGIADLLIAAPWTETTASVRVGAAYLYSGKTGKQIWRVLGTSKDELVGNNVDLVGDLDKDGVPDFVVASKPAVHVYSSKKQTLLYKIQANRSQNEWGPGVDAIKTVDLNSDGIEDIVLAWEVGYMSTVRASGIKVHSGKDGAVIYTVVVPGLSFSTYPSPMLASLSDLDKDGVPEYAVANSQHVNFSRTRSGAVTIYSGKSGKQRHLLEGHSYEGFAHALYAVDDIDKDGFIDFAVRGRPGYTKTYPHPPGSVLDVFSGKTMKVLRTIIGPPGDFELNLGTVSVGDMNRDGSPDLAIGSVSSSAGNRSNIGFFSIKALTLRSDTHCVSVFNGGSQILTLDLGPQRASQLYFLIGSGSGTQPGIKLGSLTVPLNPDAYLSFRLAAPHAMLGNNLGVLDATGRARVGFRLPVGYPLTLAGMRLEHAALILGSRGIEAVTNPASLNFVKF